MIYRDLYLFHPPNANLFTDIEERQNLLPRGPDQEMHEYVTTLLHRNHKRIGRENFTNEIITSYLSSNVHKNHQFRSMENLFDFEMTTLKINQMTLKLISQIFPNISTLKATLKTDTNPENYLFHCLEAYTKLKSLHLRITDGLTYFDKPIIKINELKLYFQTTGNNSFTLKNILTKFLSLESLTICEGYFSFCTSIYLLGDKLTRLSIKNPLIEEAETNNFEQVLNTFDLKEFKLIVTFIPDIEAHRRAMKIVYKYLTTLPHRNLIELSITMPDDFFNVNYTEIVQQLPKLKKLRLFISCIQSVNDVRNLLLFINDVRKDLQITLVYYKLHAKVKHLKEDRKLLSIFDNVRVIEKKYPYVTYKHKLNLNVKDIMRYEKLKNQKINQIYSSSEDNTDDSFDMRSLEHQFDLIHEADETIQLLVSRLQNDEDVIETLSTSLLKETSDSHRYFFDEN